MLCLICLYMLTRKIRGAEVVPLSDNLITFDNVSRFYGEVLGVNQVNLTIPPGVTSLVGPNGSGKTTLMNLMTGLIRPSQGEIRVLGISTDDPEHLCRAVGYCAQFDTFPKGLTGYQFVYSFLRVFGMSHAECDRRTMAALETVGLTDAAQPPGGRLQQGHAAARQTGAGHRARSAGAGPRRAAERPRPAGPRRSHRALREVGQGGPARHRLQPHPPRSGPHLRPGDPAQPGLRGGRRPDPGRARRGQGSADADPGALRHPSQLAARLFQEDHVVEAKIHTDGHGLLLRTTDADGFYLLLNRIVLESGLVVESVAPGR